MHDPNDYPKQTWCEREAEDRAQREEWTEEFERRMEAFDAGLCTLGAAHEGGARYGRELAETALELREEPRAIASRENPVHAALNGWLAGQRIAAAPRFAAIGNGLFVRVGDGRKKKRKAA